MGPTTHHCRPCRCSLCSPCCCCLVSFYLLLRFWGFFWFVGGWGFFVFTLFGVGGLVFGCGCQWVRARGCALPPGWQQVLGPSLLVGAGWGLGAQ